MSYVEAVITSSDAIHRRIHMTSTSLKPSHPKATTIPSLAHIAGSMATGTPIINEPEAGPSSLPSTRTVSPDPEGRTLRRPASHGRLAKLMLPGRSRSSSSASQQETTATAYADEVASGRTTPEQRRRTTRGECIVKHRAHSQRPPRPCSPTMGGTRSMRLRWIKLSRRLRA